MKFDKWVDKTLEDCWKYNVLHTDKEEMFQKRKELLQKVGKGRLKELIIELAVHILDERFDEDFYSYVDEEIQRIVGCKVCEKPIPDSMGSSLFCSMECIRNEKIQSCLD